jgi:hypothetical protein
MTSIRSGLLARLNIPQSTKTKNNISDLKYEETTNGKLQIPGHIPTARNYLVIVKESATAEITGVAR